MIFWTNLKFDERNQSDTFDMSLYWPKLISQLQVGAEHYISYHISYLVQCQRPWDVTVHGKCIFYGTSMFLYSDLQGIRGDNARISFSRATRVIYCWILIRPFSAGYQCILASSYACNILPVTSDKHCISTPHDFNTCLLSVVLVSITGLFSAVTGRHKKWALCNRTFKMAISVSCISMTATSAQHTAFQHTFSKVFLFCLIWM